MNSENKKSILYVGKLVFDVFLPLKIFVQWCCLSMARKNIKNYPQVAMFSFDSIGIDINLEGRYEAKSLGVIREFLEREGNDLAGKVALDIGANIGNHSLFFSNFFGQIFSYEPNPRTYAVLDINARFCSKSRNIVCRNYGLSDSDAELPFRTNGSNVGGSAIVNEGSVDDGVGTFLVKVRRADGIDELRDKDISLIKIDVEGHELRALEGAKQLIEKNRPIILFEQHANEIEGGASPTINYLRNLGYKFASLERSFYFGEGRVVRFFSLCLRSIFGARLKVVETTAFRKRFYDMIVAIPQ